MNRITDPRLLQLFAQHAPVTTWLLKHDLVFRMKGPPPLLQQVEKSASRGDIWKQRQEDDASKAMTLEEAPTKFQLFTERVMLPEATPDNPVYRLENTPLVLTSWPIKNATLEGAIEIVSQAVEGVTIASLLHPTKGRPVEIGHGPNALDFVVDGLSVKRFYGPFIYVVPLDMKDRASAECMGLKYRPTILGSQLLKDNQRILFQATPDVVRMIEGMPMSEDGANVSCVLVPQVRADWQGNIGLAIRV